MNGKGAATLRSAAPRPYDGALFRLYVLCLTFYAPRMAHLIHHTAIVAASAELGAGVEIGPYAIVESGACIGPRSRVMAHAYICKGSVIGTECQIHMGAVVGHAPQDVSYMGAATQTVLGDRVIVRENATIHRATNLDRPTSVGEGSFLMVGSHVAHDCQLGRGVYLANGAQLAGHVEIGDAAFVSGNVVIHQFVRIGCLAILSGGSRFSMDVPPYLIGDGANAVTSLNTVGLRRSKQFTPLDRTQLKAAYKILYRSGLALQDAVARLKAEFDNPAVRLWVEFLEHPTKRGFCHHKAGRRSAAREREGTEPS